MSEVDQSKTFCFLQHPSMAIVKGAGLVMKAIIEVNIARSTVFFHRAKISALFFFLVQTLFLTFHFDGMYKIVICRLQNCSTS